MENNFKLLEGLLYLKGSEGVEPATLKIILKISTAEARKLLNDFMKTYNNGEHGLQVVVFKDVYKFITLKEHQPYISDLVTIEKKQKLSESAIETVGIIAYKQPITKTQINNIRGVSSDGVVKTLLQKQLIEEVGIQQTPGNPILYGISKNFYDYFQISSLRELPKLGEFSEQEDEEEFDLFSSQRFD